MKKRPVPSWLAEHLANGLPDKDLIEQFWNDGYPRKAGDVAVDRVL